MPGYSYPYAQNYQNFGNQDHLVLNTPQIPSIISNIGEL